MPVAPDGRLMNMFDRTRGWVRRPSPGTVMGIVAIVIATGGAAFAAIPDGDGSIKGCYAATNGLLLGIPHSKGDTRIVDSAENCRSYEHAISWNQRGATGPPGSAPAGLGTDTGGAVAGKGTPCTIGEIMLTAGRVANGVPASGQLLAINQNDVLFSILGTTYGGDGLSNFAVPDLRAVAPDHMTYSICDFGTFPTAR